MIADTDHKVSMLYDMIHPNSSETSTIRSVFVISPDKKISLNLTYPLATGRNFPEVLRANRQPSTHRGSTGSHTS